METRPLWRATRIPSTAGPIPGHLGRLRREREELRLGSIRFFAAGDKHLGFIRSYEGKVCKVYVNRSGDPWEVEPGKVLLGRLLDTVVYDRLVLGPRGFCIVEV